MSFGLKNVKEVIALTFYASTFSKLSRLSPHPAEQALSCRISMRNMSKFSAGNLNSSAGKILSFLNLVEVQKVEWVFTKVWILNGVNTFSRYQPSSQANGQINVFYHGWGKFTNSSFSDALECFFSTLDKTSPWLKKIFKFHLLQRSIFRLLSSKKLHHSWRKFLNSTFSNALEWPF